MSTLQEWRGMRSVRQFVSNLLERQRELGVFVAWSEQRYAKRASLEILELFRSERQEHPELTGPSLYEAVVARRLGPESTNARTIVRRAEESFANWPVERCLIFRDVVLYLVINEYLQLFKSRHGTRTRMVGVVARFIPKEF
jgi:hypothetical protein